MSRPPAIEPSVASVQHARCPIFRMRACQDGPIGRKQLGAFGMQQIVAKNIDLVASRMKPVDEMQVRGELVRRIERTAAGLRTKIDDGPPASAEADAAPVPVQVVCALQPVRGDIGVGFLVEVHVLARREAERIRHVQQLVGVGEIAEGRHKQSEARARSPGSWRNEKRYVVLRALVAQPHRVDAGGQIVRRGETKGLTPLDVADVIVMEMRSVVRRLGRRDGSGAERGSGHGASWTVAADCDEPALSVDESAPLRFDRKVEFASRLARRAEAGPRNLAVEDLVRPTSLFVPHRRGWLRGSSSARTIGYRR